MTDDQVLSEILIEARAISKRLPRVVWYGFGSYFRGKAAFSDIDILTVVSTTSEAIHVRVLTEKLCARWPVHLLIMTRDEAAETGFVDLEDCRLLWGAEVETASASKH